MKKCALIAGVSLVVWFLVFVTAFSQDMDYVDNGVFPDPQRPPAVFNHEAHNEKAELYDCNECHHVYENGVKLPDESSEDQLCSDCHSLEDDGDQPGLRKAFHENCKGCHLTRDKGPVMCGECHVK